MLFGAHKVLVVVATTIILIITNRKGVAGLKASYYRVTQVLFDTAKRLPYVRKYL